MLKLVQTDWGRFDLALDDPDDADAAATLVYGVLFTDAEAAARAAEADRYDRRGWWAEPAAGSGLWHLRRQPLDGAARREALDSVRQALAARAPALTGVTVREVSGGDDAGSVSSVHIEVAGTHNGRQFLVRAPL